MNPVQVLSRNFGPKTITADAGTTGSIIIETHGKAVLAVDLKNEGSVALAGLALKRRVAQGGIWHTLQETIGSYQQASPQVLAFAIDPAQTGYVNKDPTTLGAGETVRIIIPSDGHAWVMLLPTTASGTTSVSGSYGLGD